MSAWRSSSLEVSGGARVPASTVVDDVVPGRADGLDDAGGSAALLRRERIYRRLLALADAIALSVAVVCSALVAGSPTDPSLVLAIPLVVLVSKLRGLYDHDELVILKTTLDELPRLIGVAAVVTVILDVIYGVTAGDGRSYGLIFSVLLCALGAVGLLATRSTARRLARRLSPDERCLVIGEPSACAALAHRIAELDGVELLGIASADDLVNLEPDLRRLVLDSGAHRLVIAPNNGSSDRRTLDLVHYAKATGARVSIFPTVMAALGGSIAFDDITGFTLLGVPRFGLSRSSAAIKRGFDVIGASLGLLVLGLPMLISALLIKLDSPGPVFFHQVRVGRDGRHFSMVKFRSMTDGADAMKQELFAQNEAGAGLFKITDDPRVTRIGRWLRRSKMDELPQLLNVLSGQMSLVGPRPLTVDEDERIVGLDRGRLHLTPGVTGPWQILGPMRVPLAEMVKLDYLYIANWTLWTDVKILLRTASLVGRLTGV